MKIGIVVSFIVAHDDATRRNEHERWEEAVADLFERAGGKLLPCRRTIAGLR